MPIRKAAAALATVIVSAVLLGSLVWNNRADLFNRTWSVNWAYLALSFVIYGADLILVEGAWVKILEVAGIHLPLAKHFRYYCLSNVAKRIPGTIWYVGGRAILYGRDGVAVRTIALASAAELVIMVFTGGVVYGATVWLTGGTEFALLVLVLAGAVVTGIAWRRRMDSNGMQIMPASIAWKRATGVIHSATLFFAGWIVGGLILFAVSSAFVEVAVTDLVYVIGCWAFAGVVSASVFFLPSNMGITEVSLSLTLARVMPVPVAVLVAIAMRLLITVYEVAFAIASGGVAAVSGHRESK